MSSLVDLLYRTVDAIFAVDARQRIAAWDAGCEQLFGIPAPSAIGRPCSEVVRGKNALQQPVCGGSCCLASFADTANVPSAFPLRARTADGGELRLSVSLLVVPSQRREQRLCLHLVRRGNVATVALGPRRRENVQHKDAAGGTPEAHGLTVREREVLKLLAEGSSLGAISRLMRISLTTVRNHVQHIEGKFAVHSQAETVAYAYRHNLV
ncbi:MAG: LuxR C-terminal-related transcriptional regulator [Betaproteobacteria bacterium]|nr:LuxR C-terminal-related transcriptional regulator [Betaproteobacteria bacterium]